MENDPDFRQRVQADFDYLLSIYGDTIRRYESAGRVGKFLIRFTHPKAMLVMPALREYEVSQQKVEE